MPLKRSCAQEMPMSKKHVFVLDDEGTVTMLTTMVLRSNGYDVTSSNDPVEALRVLKNDSFDLILTDIMMPCLNGFDLIREIRKHSVNNDAKLMVMTAKVMDEIERREIYDLGAEIINKPIVPHVLVEKVGMLLN